MMGLMPLVGAGSVAAIALCLSALGFAACTTARPPCSASAACSDDRACVAGTCVTIGELPPRTASRVVLRPVAVAWVRRGASDEAREPLAQLGGEHGGKLLLRFALPGAPGANGRGADGEPRLVAAHLDLTRTDLDAPLSEGDGPGVLLRTSRIVDLWEERAVTWANQPRTFDIGLPSIRVPWGTRRGRLRLDVLALVKRWPHRDPKDQGIAVEGEGAPGVTVALALALAGAGAVSGESEPEERFAPPELELYYSSAAREENTALPVQRVSGAPSIRANDAAHDGLL